eukprot:gene9468-biopygen15253
MRAMGLVGPVRPVAPVALVAPVAPVRPHPPVRSPKRTGPRNQARPGAPPPRVLLQSITFPGAGKGCSYRVLLSAGPISPGRPPRYIQDAGSPGPCPDRHGQRPASAGETGPPAQGF